MISWAGLLTRKARNRCAAAWWLLDFSTAAPDTSMTYPGSCGAKNAILEWVAPAPISARSRYQ